MIAVCTYAVLIDLVSRLVGSDAVAAVDFGLLQLSVGLAVEIGSEIEPVVVVALVE